MTTTLRGQKWSRLFKLFSFIKYENYVEQFDLSYMAVGKVK